MQIAILIIGQLRFENETMFNLFLDNIKGYDIYISTYNIYSNIAKKITDNVIFLDNHPNYKTTYQGNMYQWFHLQYLIKTYNDILSKKDIIYKIRTDVIIPKNLFNQNTNIMTIYCFTDLVFFGEAKHFIRVFENFFDDILNIYFGVQDKYININYINFVKTKKINYKWNWITYPKFIFSDNFDTLKNNIINNMDKLNCINKNNIQINSNEDKSCLVPISTLEKSDFISGLPDRIKKRSNFSSELIFPLHCIKYGCIEGIDLNIRLIKERRTFNYIG